MGESTTTPAAAAVLWPTLQPLLEQYQRQAAQHSTSTSSCPEQLLPQPQEALLQQIVAALGIHDGDDDEDATEGTVVFQVQQILRHCLDCAVAALADKKNSSSSSDAAQALLTLVVHVASRLLLLVAHPKKRTAVVESVLSRLLQCASCTSDPVRSATVESLGILVHAVIRQLQQTGSVLEESQSSQEENYNNDDSGSDCGSAPEDDDSQQQQQQFYITWLDQLQQTVIAALTDKSVAVRAAAIAAARAFQATDPEVQQGLRWLAQHDPSAPNRALACGGLSSQDLLTLVYRVRDTHVRVRVAALQRLGGSTSTSTTSPPEDDDGTAGSKKNSTTTTTTSNSLPHLQSHHLATIVRAADTDRCAVTRQALYQLVWQWLRACHFQQPMRLLHWIRVERHPVQAAQLVQILGQWYHNATTSMEEENEDEAAAVVEGSTPDEWQALRRGLDEAGKFTLTDLLSAVSNRHCDSNPQQQDKTCGDYHVERLFWIRQVLSATTTISYMHPNEKEQVFHQLVPDIFTLVQVLEGLVSQLVDMLVQDQHPPTQDDDDEKENFEDQIDSLICLCTQLLQLATLPVASLEEGSRRVLRDALTKMLQTLVTPDALVEPCVQALQQCIGDATNTNSRWDHVLEIVTPLSRPEPDDMPLRDNYQLRTLSILSIVLESWTPPPSTTHHLDALAAILLPLAQSVVSHHNNQADEDVEHQKDPLNPLVAEAAMGCLGKLGLYQHPGQVRDKYLPVMLQVALDERQERMEIRAQAMLALSDWSLVLDDVVPVEFRNLVNRFLLTVMKPQKSSSIPITGTVCVVAEIAAKLLLAGKVCDSHWLAALVAIFFADGSINGDADDDYCSEHNDIEDVTEVGSPVRLQQLLSVFFPAVTARWKTVRDALTGCVGSLLPLACRDKKLKKALPRILDFIVSTVEQGAAQAQQPATTAEGEEEKESSPELIVAVQVATYLTESASDLNTTTLRALCKVIGTLQLDLDQELYEHLSLLKELLEELGNIMDDATSLRSLALAAEQLVHVEMEEEVREDEDDDDEEEATSIVPSRSFAKENHGLDGSDDDNDDDYDFRAPKGSTISSSTRRSTRRRRLRPSN